MARWAGTDVGHAQGAEGLCGVTGLQQDIFSIHVSVSGCHTKLLAWIFPQIRSVGALQSDVLWHCALGNLDIHLIVVFKQRQRQSLVRRHYLIHPSSTHSSFLSVSHGTPSAVHKRMA